MNWTDAKTMDIVLYSYEETQIYIGLVTRIGDIHLQITDLFSLKDVISSDSFSIYFDDEGNSIFKLIRIIDSFNIQGYLDKAKQLDPEYFI